MDNNTVMERIGRSGIVPVAMIDAVEKAVPLANAMLAGGVDVIEVTFRTAAASGAIRSISQSCPDMLVGAGTVISLKQCRLAVESGAQFIVSPGFSRDVVGWCAEHKIPVVPGCITATEITAAMEYGLRVVKFFPSNLCGGAGGDEGAVRPVCRREIYSYQRHHCRKCGRDYPCSLCVCGGRELGLPQD